jgi:Ca2+-binding EF-hand superfamily protein
LISEFRNYRKTEKRKWFGEQEELSQLFNTIQAKLKTNRRPRYVPPAGLAPSDIDADMNDLNSAEAQRRSALNAQLRAILENLRTVFANLANNFHDKLASHKSALASSVDQDLDSQISTLKGRAGELALLENDLAAIQQAERDCDAANIEENDKTDHTYDDLWFAHNLLTKTFQKTIDLLENQASAREQADVSAEQVNEFKETFKHFDQDHDEKLSRLEFKSCLSGLGVVALDFEGSDKRFESIFAKVANGGTHVDFQQFLSYMIDITKDEGSPEQIRESFNVLAGGKDFITENDMKVGQMSAEQIAFLKSVLPPKAGIEGGYDYSDYVNSHF